jgi:hypothetical protein
VCDPTSPGFSFCRVNTGNVEQNGMLQHHLHDVREALSHGLLYIALSQCLAFPDVCGALESVDGKATGARYKAWFDKYVSNKYSAGAAFASYQTLTGDDCYYFRCSLLHQSITTHHASRFERIIFTTNIQWHNVLVAPGDLDYLPIDQKSRSLTGMGGKGALLLNLTTFCEDIMQGVEVWAQEKKDEAQVAANYARTIKPYPNGFQPFQGMMVIT